MPYILSTTSPGQYGQMSMVDGHHYFSLALLPSVGGMCRMSQQ